LEIVISIILAHKRIPLFKAALLEPTALMPPMLLILAAMPTDSQISRRPTPANVLSSMISMAAATTTNIAAASQSGLSY